MIVFHQGLGASIEDNAAMHEWFASYGFVFINTAYQSSDEPRVLNVEWDLELSKAEIDFILDEIANYSFVDMESTGIMGQSYGAQAALSYPLGTQHKIKGVLSLDSTMDYLYRCQNDGFKPLLDLLFSHKTKLNMPLLVFAGTNATFAVMDSITDGERHYFYVQDQEHGDFISQGAVRAYLETPLIAEQNKELHKNRWGNYLKICQYSLAFWKATLKDNKEAWNEILAAPKSNYINYAHRQKGENNWAKYFIEHFKELSPKEFKPMLGKYNTSEGEEYELIEKNNRLFFKYKKAGKKKYYS